MTIPDEAVEAMRSGPLPLGWVRGVSYQAVPEHLRGQDCATGIRAMIIRLDKLNPDGTAKARGGRTAMAIPDEAVEAAAAVLKFEDDNPGHNYPQIARLALEAAAPYIQVGALEDAAKAAEDPNPDDIDNYFIDQADVAGWLRARASEREGIIMTTPPPARNKMTTNEEFAADIRSLGITILDDQPADLSRPLAQHLHDLGYRKASA